MTNYNTHHLFVCKCGYCRHAFIITNLKDKNEEDRLRTFKSECFFDYSSLYIHIFVDTFDGFWKRLWKGVKWVFGKETDLLTNVMIDDDDRNRLIVVLNDFLNDYKEWKEADFEPKSLKVEDYPLQDDGFKLSFKTDDGDLLASVNLVSNGFWHKTKLFFKYVFNTLSTSADYELGVETAKSIKEYVENAKITS